ncbi:hypothetical protein Tco_1298503, partial [Tanacetum coccineum]
KCTLWWCDWDGGDDDDSGVAVAVAASGEDGVEARGVRDRVDRMMRILFDFGQNTRRKSFLAVVGQKR